MSDIAGHHSASTDASAEPLRDMPQRRERLKARALVIGAICAALTAVLVTQAEVVLSTIHIGYLQFPPASLGLLLLVIGFNRVVKWMQIGAGLDSSDVLVVYCMSLVSAMVSSHGVVQKLVPLLVMPQYYADKTNDWQDKFDPHLKPGLVAYDPHIAHRQSNVDSYYLKLEQGQSIPWHAWIAPILNWGLLIALVLTAFLCLTSLLRKQWVDNEKLAFPLAQLPLEIAGDETTGSFFRNGLLWLGVLVPTVVYGIKTMHMLWPLVPDIQLNFDLASYVTNPPWSAAANWFYFIISFAAIGFFYLLSVDVLFSVWFFFILARLEQVVMISHNIPLPYMTMYPVPLFVGFQTVGAYFVLVAYFLWIGRAHLKHIWASVIGQVKPDDENELLSYRSAFWGLIGSIVLATAWLWHLGMSPNVAVYELVVLIFVTAVVLTRATAEAGLLMTETTFRPMDVYQMIAPLHSLGAQNLTMLAFMDGLFIRDQRGLLMTGMMDVARMADGTRIKRSSFVGIIALGVVIAFVVAVGLNIYLPYHLGGLNMDHYTEGAALGIFGDYSNSINNQPQLASGAAWQMPTFMAVGMVVTVILSVMRASFFWWPLHPLGYALSGSWGTIQFWFPCFIAWICKTLTLRYGGMTMYRTLRPFFLGLVIGEFGIAVVLVMLNILFHIPVPAFPWG